MNIKKLILHNFCRFRSYELEFDPKLNVLIGGNEAGKSSVLMAINLVLSASRSKVETLGLESLFNSKCIDEFLQSDWDFAKLPELFIELYLQDNGNDFELDGRNNSTGTDAIGIKMVCKPIADYSKEFKSMSSEQNRSFPFEFYSIQFLTFADIIVQPFKKPLKHLFIDSSEISNEYATRDYIRSMYAANATISQRNSHGFKYRNAKAEFRNDVFSEMNNTLARYKFDVRTSVKANIETDIIITEDAIPIDRKGKGRQCFIKTEFALRNTQQDRTLDVLLLEEPENHLSYLNLRKLIERIRESESKQLFIATHSSFIATRLELRKVMILSEVSATQPVTLRELNQDTAKYFMKAPDNYVLELALCKKAILVEGDAEFILIDALYKKSTNGCSLENDGIHVISVDGTSFKRYLDLAKLLKVKVAVIRDNDRNYKANCEDSYIDYVSNSIKIFASDDNAQYTFEICIYHANKAVCDELFSSGRKSLTVEEYMLKNKTEAAFKLLEKEDNRLVTPDYIAQAIKWIKQ